MVGSSNSPWRRVAVPGLVAPNFIAARLVYKLLSYRFGLKA